jgi:hypothetical protein
MTSCPTETLSTSRGFRLTSITSRSCVGTTHHQGFAGCHYAAHCMNDAFMYHACLRSDEHDTAQALL